jgi:molybdopterin converting factor small subunit
MIAEWMSKNVEQLSIPENATLEDLRAILIGRCEELPRISYSIAVNSQMAAGNPVLKQYDEISVFPPFAGG